MTKAKRPKGWSTTRRGAVAVSLTFRSRRVRRRKLPPFDNVGGGRPLAEERIVDASHDLPVPKETQSSASMSTFM